MTDAADRAQLREEEEREQALLRLARAWRRAAATMPLSVDGKRVCRDCLDPIDRKRLRAAPEALRCVECQALHERRNGRDIQ